MEITKTVFEEYRTVQESGAVNMFDRNGVQKVAYELDCHHLVAFIENGDYAAILENYGELRERYEQ